MSRTSNINRHSKFVIRIVCEGEKTEPLFFTGLCDDLLSGVKDMDIRTIPEPETFDEEPVGIVRGDFYKGKKRKTKKQKNKEQPEKVVIQGKPPVKWVLHGHQLLSDGVDEVWAVYDKDEHPEHEAAVAEAAKEIDGKKVKIAFSSRSFEYYLLLHFEYIYKAFPNTECKTVVNGKREYVYCGKHIFPKIECNGNHCINGYARLKNYWDDSKTGFSTYNLVKDKLLVGIINARNLRKQSDAASDLPFHQRNPYTNADELVCRLLNIGICDAGSPFSLNEKGENYTIIRSDDLLTIINHNNKGSLLFIPAAFNAVNIFTSERRKVFSKSVILNPEEQRIIELPDGLNKGEVLEFTLSSGKRILFL